MCDVKCKVIDNIVHPCWVLKQVLEEANSTRKGLSEIVIRNEKFEVVKTGVVLRSGQHGKRGILVNHCPFCGEYIASAFDGQRAARKVTA